jgi:uncharacterized repeat protein (TIGR01451 family)
VYVGGVSGNSYSISGSTFTGNQATANGGAVANAGSGMLLFNYNRVVGNTAASGSGVYDASSASMDVSNVWWGSNLNPSGVTGLISGTVTSSPWLVLGTTASPASLNAGGTATVTASFLKNSAGTNLSASNLTALVGVTVSFAATGGTVAPTSATIQNTGQATATYTAGPTAGSGTASATVDNGTATANLTITGSSASADLGVQASGSSSVIAGTTSGTNNLTYTVTLTNTGPNSASNIQVTDTLTLPTGVTVSSATSASQGSYNLGSGLWSVGSLANGASATLTLVLSVPSSVASGAVVQESASVTASSVADPNSANNTSSTSTTVQTQADLSISNTGPTSANAGDPAGYTYTLTVTNNGPSNNTGGFTVTDTLPAGATFQSTGSDPGWSASGQALTYTTSSGLASGASQNIIILVTV